MNIIKYLTGESDEVCQNEKILIETDITEFIRKVKDKEDNYDINELPIYILKTSKDLNDLKLYQYIDILHDNCQISNKILAKLHICKYINFYNNVSFIDDSGNNSKINDIEFLLKKLEPGKNCSIIIDNNDRSLLADIVQQLIYIDYPISEINVSMKKEFKDAERTKAFMSKIDILDKTANEALKNIQAIKLPDDAKNDASYEKYKESAIEAC